MKKGVGFLEYLETDVALKILMLLNNPADLIRTSAVSRFWHDFVIANGILKQLCFTKFPQLSKISGIVELKHKEMDNLNVESSSGTELAILERDHKLYASMLKYMFNTKESPIEFMLSDISASSTDHDPIESIYNTLTPVRLTHWSSKGHSDHNASETLLYELNTSISVVTEINIRPYEAFHLGKLALWSAKSVRFRMGHQDSQGNFVCTYTSPEFSMNQFGRIQQFKLPEPVLCIGGFLQIELLGMVHQADDGLFYVGIKYVYVKGILLQPTFNIVILEPSGEFLLNYQPEYQPRTNAVAKKA
ncbi:hypothetical protein ACJIZ3_013933 [Penstemon smallii]|uniref:F-box domain-containing protein n=1 Tax=Penstemon smallii TaxID=265156 RepID=A0ABD3RIA8_9LAMI